MKVGVESNYLAYLEEMRWKVEMLGIAVVSDRDELDAPRASSHAEELGLWAETKLRKEEVWRYPYLTNLPPLEDDPT